MKLDVKSFGLTCGIVAGFGLFALAWWIMMFEGQPEAGARPPFLGLLYRGYAFTPMGSLLGLAWGFGDGLVGGAVFAWLYNCLSQRSQAS